MKIRLPLIQSLPGGVPSTTTTTLHSPLTTAVPVYSPSSFTTTKPTPALHPARVYASPTPNAALALSSHSTYFCCLACCSTTFTSAAPSIRPFIHPPSQQSPSVATANIRWRRQQQPLLLSNHPSTPLHHTQPSPDAHHRHLNDGSTREGRNRVPTPTNPRNQCSSFLFLRHGYFVDARPAVDSPF